MKDQNSRGGQGQNRTLISVCVCDISVSLMEVTADVTDVTQMSKK